MKIKQIITIVLVGLLMCGVSIVTGDVITQISNCDIQNSNQGSVSEYAMFSPYPGYFAVQWSPEKKDEQSKYPAYTYLYQSDTDSISGEVTGNPDSLQDKQINNVGSPFVGDSPSLFRSAYLDEINYLFLSPDNGNSCAIYGSMVQPVDPPDCDTWNVMWTGPISLNYSPYQNTIFSASKTTFRVVPSDDGIYLISKQGIFTNSSYLDISFISKNELESGVESITPVNICRLQNSGNFTPIPDSILFDVLITTDPDTQNPVIIGVSDYGGSIVAWWFDLTNPSNHDASILPIIDTSEPIDLALFQGSTNNLPSGMINNINAIAHQFIPGMDNRCMVFSTDFRNITSGGQWSYEQESVDYDGFYESTGNICTFYDTVPCALGYRQNILSGVITNNNREDDFARIEIDAIASNMLKFNTTTNSTWTGFGEYGNLAVPIGFIDGVTPISLNGHTIGDDGVNSVVTYLNDVSKDTSVTGSTEASVAVKASGEFLDGAVGVDASYSHSVTNANTKSTTIDEQITTNVDLSAMPDNPHAFMQYLGPEFFSTIYDVYDAGYQKPQSDQKQVFLITINDYINDIQAYNLSGPAYYPWLEGTLKSPMYHNFDNWSWSTSSGGWLNRDWQYSPANNNFTIFTLNDQLVFSGGGTTTTTFDMTTEVDTSTEVTNEVETTASICDVVSITDKLKISQQHEVDTTCSYGIEFDWKEIDPDSGKSGVTDLHVEALMLTPDEEGSVPWVPQTYNAFKPWLLTYNVLSWDDGSTLSQDNPATITMNVYPKEAGAIVGPTRIVNPNEKIILQAVPKAGYVFSHWKSYGIDLDDYSSPAVNGVVRNKFSTIRAYFIKPDTTLVKTGFISADDSSPTNQIKIQGTIPTGFTKLKAQNLKTPIEVKVGSRSFLFGSMIGTSNIVSDNQIAYTTTDPKNGLSNLRLDFGANTWWFSTNQVQDLMKNAIRSNVVTIGFGGKNVSASEDIPMSGKGSLFWSGSSENISNSLFSLSNATVTGSVRYLSGEPDFSTVNLKNGKILTETVDPVKPFTMTINGIEIAFANATGVKGDVISYQKNWNDLNATITVNSKTGSWDALLNGKRLGNTFWSSGLPVGIQIGSDNANVVIHPNASTSLKTLNLGPFVSDEKFMGELNTNW